MSFFELIVPHKTTNIVIGPSAEGGTANTIAGFGSAYGTASNNNLGTAVATIAVTGTAAFRGNYSYPVAFTGVAAAGSCATGLSVNLGSAVANQSYYVSFYAKGTPSAMYCALQGSVDWSAGSTTWAASTCLATPAPLESEGTAWARYGCSIAPKAGGTVAYIIVPATITTAMLVDCVQVEEGDHPTTYIDHDVPDTGFAGKKYFCHTTRSAQVRSGGEVKNLWDDYGVNVMNISGHQSPPQQQSSYSRAALDGSFWLQTRTSERPLQLACSIEGSSLADYHAKRDAFFYDIQRDRAAPPQPFVLRYRGAGRTVQLPVVYDAGMEGNQMTGPTSEVFPLRVIAYDDPYWTEPRQGQALINKSATLAVEQMVAYRPSQPWSATTGFWDNLGAPELTITALAAENIRCFAKDRSGNLYIGGDFLNLGGIAEADYIAKRSPVGTWSALDAANIPDGTVYKIAVAADGTLYVVGVFQNLKDANGDSVSSWNGNTWTSLGSGAGAFYLADVICARDGAVYVGGASQNIGGIAAADYIAKWSGGAWSALHATPPNDTVNCLAEGPDGSIYAGGEFTTVGGVTVNHVAKYNPTTASWSALGSGCNDWVFCLTVGPDGTLYAGGMFTTAGGQSAVRIAAWNGSFWRALGSGLNAAPNVLQCDEKGYLYVGGSFTTAGGISLADRIAVWTGTSWSPLGIDFPGAAIGYGFMVDSSWRHGRRGEDPIPYTDIYFGFDTEGDATIYGITISATSGVVTNIGTAKSWPIIYITRSGGTSVTLQGIYNESTGKKIDMVHALLDGETVVLDLRQGKKTFYSETTRLNLLSEVNPTSDLAILCLIPGDNYIGVMCPGVGSPTVTVRMVWDIKHWSADGGAHAES